LPSSHSLCDHVLHDGRVEAAAHDQLHQDRVLPGPSRIIVIIILNIIIIIIIIIIITAVLKQRPTISFIRIESCAIKSPSGQRRLQQDSPRLPPRVTRRSNPLFIISTTTR
jgi:hypothetical protein